MRCCKDSPVCSRVWYVHVTKEVCCCACRRGLHVTAIVRSPCDDAARERLRSSFGSADQALLAAFDGLADSRLTVRAGKTRGALDAKLSYCDLCSGCKPLQQTHYCQVSGG